MHVLLLSKDKIGVEQAKTRILFDGITSVVAENTDDAIGLISRSDFDVVAVDFAPQDARSENALGRIRSVANATPVLAVVSSDLDGDRDATRRILALHAGFDAAIPSSSSHAEFVAILRNLALRRAGLVPPVATFGKLRINFALRRAFAKTQDLMLPRQAYELLEYLVLRFNKVVSNGLILERFDETLEREPLDQNSVDYISRRLRRYLEPAGLGGVIKVHPGQGMSFEAGEAPG
jgi:DNA-binding response OmpR family regulator